MFEASAEEQKRFDYRTIQAFLNGAITAFSQLDLISPKEIEEIKLSYRTLATHMMTDQTTPWNILRDSDSEFFMMLRLRYGEKGLHGNIFRLTLQRLINKTAATLQQLTMELLTKSQIVFNRPMGIFVAEKCEKKTLYSGVLVEVAAHLLKCQTDLKELKSHQLSFLPNAMINPNDLFIDRTLATILDFPAIDDRSLPLVAEKHTIRLLCTYFQNTIDIIDTACQQIAHNTIQSQTEDHPFAAICEWMKGETFKLQMIFLSTSQKLSQWESYRVTIISCLLGLNKGLMMLKEESHKIIETRHLASIDMKTMSPLLERQVASSLIDIGADFQSAVTAGKTLIQYCIDQKVTPNELISEELAKLHPLLTKKTLQNYQDLGTDKALLKEPRQLKKSILEKSESLMRDLKMAIISIISVLLVGCGVKTNPQSQTSELRPSIPYQIKPAQTSDRQGVKIKHSDGNLKKENK